MVEWVGEALWWRGPYRSHKRKRYFKVKTYKFVNVDLEFKGPNWCIKSKLFF